MSKETKNNVSAAKKQGQKRGCHMAYSLNNYQPVQCTLVSDQPFFYMDEAYDMDDDIMFGEEMLEEFMGDGTAIPDDMMLSELSMMKKKMDGYERIENAHQKLPLQSLNEFINNAAIMTQTGEPAQINLDNLIYNLRQSRMAAALMDFAVNHDIQLNKTLQHDAVYFDVKANIIFVPEMMSEAEAILSLVKNFRQIWQAAHGVSMNPIRLHPDHAIVVNRAQQADLYVTLIRCAWEMKLAGLDHIWGMIEQSSLNDLGRSLAREAIYDFRSLNNGKAMSAVFEAWFLSERCQNEDKDIIQAMIEKQNDLDYMDADLSYKTAMEILSTLGAQPHGRNYLRSQSGENYAAMILSDGLFTEVRDRSNANFLWFIKFERRFSEAEKIAEQKLHSSSLIKLADVLPSYYKKEIEDFAHGDNIIPAPTGGDNIITLSF